MTEQNHILIIDDSHDIQELLKLFLEGEGYKVSTATNGVEALDLLNTSVNETPDLILLDLMMPFMDGYEFLRAQEKIPKLAQIPVVLMTANGHSQSANTGAQGFLKKPFSNPDAILQTINQVIHH